MKKIIEVSIVIAVFIGINIVAHFYEDSLLLFANHVGSLGVIFYVATTALAIIIPVWSNMFMIPIASVMWGPFATVWFSVLGWLIGSQTSFLIGRLFEKEIMKAFPSLHASQYVERLVSKKYPTLSLIFLRMTIPVDILSYGLGLFAPRISSYQNLVTTFVGIIPFAFLFSYFDDIPKVYSIGLLTITTTLFVIYSTVMLRGGVKSNFAQKKSLTKLW